jgi:amino acid transporter
MGEFTKFLLAYGWAIMVVLIAIAALAYFGVLNTGNFKPNLCWCSTENMTEVTRLKADGITYIECAKTIKFLNDEKTKIERQYTYSLFYCSENKTLIPVG